MTDTTAVALKIHGEVYKKQNKTKQKQTNNKSKTGRPTIRASDKITEQKE